MHQYVPQNTTDLQVTPVFQVIQVRLVLIPVVIMAAGHFELRPSPFSPLLWGRRELMNTLVFCMSSVSTVPFVLLLVHLYRCL